MCISCKGKVAYDKTDYIEKSQNHVVLIQDVPCEKCEQCGETYFDNDTVCMLETILNKARYISTEITLSVLDYTQSAA